MTSAPGDPAENSGRNDDRHLDGDVSTDRSADTETGLAGGGEVDARGIAPDDAALGARDERRSAPEDATLAAAGDCTAASVNEAARDVSAVGPVASPESAAQVESAVGVGPVASPEPAAHVESVAGAGSATDVGSAPSINLAVEVEQVDGATRDVVRLLRRFGGRAFALAFVAGITGLTTVALVLGLVGFALVLAPVRGVRQGGGPAAPVPPGW